MSEQIRRDFTLNYSLQKVKVAIEDTCRTSTGSYQIKDRNQVFNSYSISLVKMLTVLPITIGLNAVSETETKFSLSAVPGPQLSRNPYMTNEMLDAFLGKMGYLLSGKVVVKTTVRQISGRIRWIRILIFWAIVIGTVIGVVLLIMKT
jgi:hypothetical protein